MTHTLGMTIPQEARRLGSHARKPDEVTKDIRIFDRQAFNHNRRSIEISRHRPRRISSREMATTMPLRSRGRRCRAAYASAKALPSRAKRALSEPGCSWIPLWSTPLLRPLVSSPARACRSTTMIRSGRSQRRALSSLAMAHPTTPAPTMQTSYVSMALHALCRFIGRVHVEEW